MNHKSRQISELFEDALEKLGDENFIIDIPVCLTKKFLSYCAMFEDLGLVLEYIELLEKATLSNTIKSSLTYSIICLYGKCFTKADNGYSKLESKYLFKSENLITHENLMILRNKFIAHRSDSDSEYGIAYLAINKDTQVSDVNFKLLKKNKFNAIELERVRDLTIFLRKKLEEKKIKSGQKARKTFISKYDFEQMQEYLLNKD
ncbi:MAG: hypothetical protein ACKVKQ_08810 [Flavobacteriales bacterium]|jgi:hypothetical protein